VLVLAAQGSHTLDMKKKRLALPLSDRDIKSLKCGDSVLLTGVMLTARDASHKRIVEALAGKAGLPFELERQTIYYTGPSPARPGRIVGSAGPTTSSRMDKYTPVLLEKGVKCMIGKGKRSAEVRQVMLKHRAVYLAAIGGAGVLLSRTIKRIAPVAYPELGAEAVFRLEVEDFPAVVINDIYGGDLYDTGRATYRTT
jgi:fumarate hydratase subunit beta